MKKQQKRKRYGCDSCKQNPPTEKFNGICGGELWICGECYKKLISWNSKQQLEAKIK